MFGVPPNTLAMQWQCTCYRYFATGYYCIWTCHSKQFSVGLMVLSWWFCVLSEDREENLLNPPKLSCGFNFIVNMSLHTAENVIL